MASWNAHIFVERLHLSATAGQVVVPCPFHADALPSLSVNLDKGVFYCFGACPEPRGGGAVAFVQKWAQHVDGAPISRSEAAARVRGAFSVRTAQDYLLEEAREEVRLFAQYMLQTSATRARQCERAVAQLHAEECQDPEAVGGDVWVALAAWYREIAWCDYVFAVCLHAQHDSMTPEVLSVLRDATRLGFWSRQVYAHVRLASLRQQARRRAEREPRPHRARGLLPCPKTKQPVPIPPQTILTPPSSRRT